MRIGSTVSTRRGVSFALLALCIGAPIWVIPAPAGAVAGALASPSSAASGAASAVGSADAAAQADLQAEAELTQWLERLTGADETARRQAVAALAEPLAPTAVSALAAKLGVLARRADHAAMLAALQTAKARAHERLTAFDWFERLASSAHPGDAGWRDLLSLVGLCRRLAQLGTTDAVRKLIDVESEFGDVVRVDLDSTMARLADRAVPALLEARKAESKTTRAWATKTLENLGKSVPGAAVETSDDQVLAEVLLAYGRTRDTDAARVVLTFANSTRMRIRDTAREAILMYADAAMPVLKEAYEALEARKASEDWSWDVLATQLFRAYDRARLSDAYALMDRGLELQKRGALDGMATAFDQVLARAPDFERRGEMASGYLALARSVQPTNRPRALALVRKAARLGATGSTLATVESERLYLEALDLLDRGIVDRPSLQRAIELDPTNERAATTLRTIDAESRRRTRGLYAGITSAVAATASLVLGITLLVRRHLRRGRRRRRPS